MFHGPCFVGAGKSSLALAGILIRTTEADSTVEARRFSAA